MSLGFLRLLFWPNAQRCGGGQGAEWLCVTSGFWNGAAGESLNIYVTRDSEPELFVVQDRINELEDQRMGKFRDFVARLP